jgi:hypothetical protein
VASEPEALLAVLKPGDSSMATKIRYSGRERERSEATGRAWAWLTALNCVIGYRHYRYFATFWVIGFVAAGAFILRVSGEGPRNGMPYGVAYSFDMLLPIIQLPKEALRYRSARLAPLLFLWAEDHGLDPWLLPGREPVGPY